MNLENKNDIQDQENLDSKDKKTLNDTQLTSEISVQVSQDYRINIKKIKYSIYKALKEKKIGLWKDYWMSLQKFLIGKLARKEFEDCVISLLGIRNIHLHNQLLVGILHNAHTEKISLDSKNYFSFSSIRKTKIQQKELNEQKEQREQKQNFQSKKKNTIHHLTETPPSEKCQPMILKKLDLVNFSTEFAINSILKRTRSKIVRLNSKEMDQRSSAILSQLSKCFSKKNQRKRKISNVFTDIKEQEPIKESIKEPIKEPIKEQKKEQKKEDFKYFSSFNQICNLPDLEEIPNYQTIQEIVQTAIVNTDLKGTTPDIINLLQNAVEIHLKSLLIACIEYTCSHELGEKKRIFNSERKEKKMFLSWPSKNLNEKQTKTSCIKSVDGISSKLFLNNKNKKIIISTFHLYQTLIQYPYLVGADLTLYLERIATSMQNPL